MASQMVFSGTAGCPAFNPNPWKADICQGCQNKIQSHNNATSDQVAAALEFCVPSVPSLVSENLGAPLHLGGYKAAVNAAWLRKSKVGLIVDTAGGLASTLGPKYTKALQRRAAELPEVKVTSLQLKDDLQQQLDTEVLRTTVREVLDELSKGNAVLVHCAQGKSRSTTVVLCILCWAHKIPVSEALAMVKAQRAMAEPNSNFLQQLQAMEQDGVFNQLDSS